MKKTIKSIILLAALALGGNTAAAFDFNSILNGLGEAVENGTVTDILEGVFATSDIQVQDLAGEWTSTGSAVCFQSENLLNKAGGIAAASTIESKLNPYYEKYGLTGAVFTIQTDGTFTLQVKKIKLQGTITKKDDGNFTFEFQALGKIKIGAITTYVQKTSSSMDVMFDASKLQNLMSSVASLTGNSMAQTASSLLNSYEGICVGFKLSKSGNVSTTSTQQQTVTPTQTATTTEEPAEEETDDVKNTLLNLFKKK